MKRLWVLLLPLLAVACGEEGPTQVGEGLLPPGAVQTFEVILEPHQYLVFDTAFGQYSDAADATFMVAANSFDDGLTSNVLARFNLPTVVNVVDTLGTGRADTAAVFLGARIRMLVDTLRSTEAPIRLAVYQVTQPWHASATWSLRVDTAGAQVPWATPGGARGVLLDTLTWEAGNDTLTIRLDSATIAGWRQDREVMNRGLMIVAQTPGARIRMSPPQMTVQAVSSFRPDTVYDVFTATFRRTFVFTPEQPAVAAAPRVGGTPAWRTVLRLQDRLDTLSFACPGVPNCRVRLSEASINHAGLRLQPVPPPPGLRPEADLVVGAYLMETSPLLPLERSPLSELIGIATMPRTSFMAPNAPVREISITEMIRRAATPPEQWPEGAPAPTFLALTPGPDPILFGFAAFEAMPRLRLVISTAQELQLP